MLPNDAPSCRITPALLMIDCSTSFRLDCRSKQFFSVCFLVIFLKGITATLENTLLEIIHMCVNHPSTGIVFLHVCQCNALLLCIVHTKNYGDQYCSKYFEHYTTYYNKKGVKRCQGRVITEYDMRCTGVRHTSPQKV